MKWVILIVLLAGAAVFYKACRDVSQQPTVEIGPGVVQDPALTEEFLRLKKENLSLKQRLLTREVQPRRIREGTKPLTPEQVKGIPKVFVEVKKQGKDLTVKELDHTTGDVRELQYPLPRKDSNYTLRGGRDTSLRTGRNWPFRLGVAARLSYPLVGGTDPSIEARGPIEIGGEHWGLAPYGRYVASQGGEAGVQLEVRF